ncbi:hypothetical protein RJT34_15387 [Clitoria ternatea]|uniref:Uncharacterized protein n=1 Tax=Clitoria ternatea TaxID=43366 RepID=A0AAN9PBX9_CLITE
MLNPPMTMFRAGQGCFDAVEVEFEAAHEAFDVPGRVPMLADPVGLHSLETLVFVGHLETSNLGVVFEPLVVELAEQGSSWGGQSQVMVHWREGGAKRLCKSNESGSSFDHSYFFICHNAFSKFVSGLY